MLIFSLGIYVYAFVALPHMKVFLFEGTQHQNKD